MIPLSCDTVVALHTATGDGSVILAKNSDRDSGESQPLTQVPRLRHAPGSPLKCQYIEIPQVEETLALIGSRPHWLWGFEHGMNECGVAIGNEAVFTKETLPDIGLLGMDLVRLGLERGRTAREALDTITRLLEEFGQGGSGSEHVTMCYCNSFIVADPTEAFILETSGRQYAWKAVADTGCISNHVSLGADWDALSGDAVSYAVSNDWWHDGSERLDFSAAYRSTDMVPPQISEERLSQSRLLLDEYRGRITTRTMMRTLRDHYDSGTVFTPGREFDDGKRYTICMHADPIGTTTASMVAHLRSGGSQRVYWASLGTACCGVFMPLYLEGDIPTMLTHAGPAFSRDSAWWLFKKLDDCVAEDFATRTVRVQEVWAEMEDGFQAAAAEVETEAEALRSRGEHEQARSRLTRFMASNLESVLARLQNLLAEFQNGE